MAPLTERRPTPLHGLKELRDRNHVRLNSRAVHDVIHSPAVMSAIADTIEKHQASAWQQVWDRRGKMAAVTEAGRDPSRHAELNGVSSSPTANTTHSQTSSVGSSQGKVGTMELETVPCDMVDGFSSEDEAANAEDDSTWGRLFPVGNSFTSFDLSKESYTFGRDDACDYSFNTPVMRKHSCFQAYSKTHFILSKEVTSTGVHVFLTDKSSNGTFINGEKIGKGNKQVLNNCDEIALAMKSNKAFVFMDAKAGDDSNIPEELREKYTLSRLLGRGACGEVKLAFEKGSCKKFAVKIISKKKFTVGGKHAINVQNATNQVMSEVKILKSLKHPCIIGIEEVIDTPDTLYIVLELVEGGELFDRVVEAGQFPEPLAKLLFYQMVVACKYLHDQGITHRDLKPENILLANEDKETLVKVTDFGLSKFVDGQSMMKTFCGTPNYLAPEILLTAGIGSYTKAIDCWSLGVILYICLVGYPPFSDDRTDMELPKQIKGGHYDFPAQYWKGISEEAKSLCRELMTVDPEKRITLADALNHAWFKDEAMKTKAQNLMFPDSGGMAPPTALKLKRLAENIQESESNNNKSPKKRRTDSQDGVSPKKASVSSE